MSRRALPLILLLALTLNAVPAVAGQEAPLLVDVPDATGDVSGKLPDRSDGYVDEPGIDVTRFVVDLRGDEVIVRYDTAGAPVVEGTEVVFTARYRVEGLSEFGIHFTWDSDGNPSTTLGTLQDRDREEIFEPSFTKGADSVTLSFPSDLLPEDTECLDAYVYVSNGQSMDSAGVPVDGCGGSEPRLDGVDGSCPAPTLPADVKTDWSFTDPAGDAEHVTVDYMTGKESREPTDDPTIDVVGVTSKREGDRIVQTVTLAQDLTAEAEFSVRVENALAGGGRYLVWDMSVSGPGTGIGADSVDAYFTDDPAEPGTYAPVFAERSGPRTVTVEFCASLIPADAVCFAPDAKTGPIFSWGAERTEDHVPPSPDSCKGKASFTPPEEDDGSVEYDDDYGQGDYYDEDGCYEDEHGEYLCPGVDGYVEPRDDAGTSTGATDDAEEKGTPAPGALVGALAVAGAALVLGARRR